MAQTVEQKESNITKMQEAFVMRRSQDSEKLQAKLKEVIAKRTQLSSEVQDLRSARRAIDRQLRKLLNQRKKFDQEFEKVLSEV